MNLRDPREYGIVPDRHELVLEFGRLLSADEWAEVIRQVNDHVPYVVRRRADAKEG